MEEIEKQVLSTREKTPRIVTPNDEIIASDLAEMTSEVAYDPESNMTDSEPLSVENLEEIESELDLSQYNSERGENKIEVDELANMAQSSD